MPELTSKRCLNRIDLNAVAAAIKTITQEHDSSKTCDGGILAIQVQNHGKWTIESAHVGNPGDRAETLKSFADEKMDRLISRRKEGKAEYASSQSADPAQGKYGGCIVAWGGFEVEVFISFSGAPSLVDEALVYVLAELLNLSVDANYENKYVPRMRELLKGAVL